MVTPRGRYHSQHEAACGAERLFQCLWCAQTSRAMFPHARAQSCCHVEARTRSRRTPHFFILTVTASLAKCEAPTCCCKFASACCPLHVAIQAASRGRELQDFSGPGGHAKEKGSVARANCDDSGSGSARLCADVGS